jgi:uncharacterized OB-fold protein
MWNVRLVDALDQLAVKPLRESANIRHQNNQGITMPDLTKKSPLGVYIEHCRKGELAYQVTGDGAAVFYPRAVAPGTGSDQLEWRVSKGLGTVYATTVVYTKDQPPHNVALIDVDEGFRMMSRVEDIDPLQVKIGMRVKVRIHPGDEKQPPYPVFTAQEASR